jgi:hypothetical protein
MAIFAATDNYVVGVSAAPFEIIEGNDLPPMSDSAYALLDLALSLA